MVIMCKQKFIKLFPISMHTKKLLAPMRVCEDNLVFYGKTKDWDTLENIWRDGYYKILLRRRHAFCSDIWDLDTKMSLEKVGSCLVYLFIFVLSY